MEVLEHCPLEGEKLQLVCWVVGFSLSAILSGLIEDSSQASATRINMKLEQLGEVCICKNRCHGAESLQIIEGLLIPTVPLNGSLLPAGIFTRG